MSKTLPATPAGIARVLRNETFGRFLVADRPEGGFAVTVPSNPNGVSGGQLDLVNAAKSSLTRRGYRAVWDRTAEGPLPVLRVTIPARRR